MISLGVLISGSGTNLQSIMDAIERKSLTARINIVISNRRDAFGLDRAKRKNIPAICIPHTEFPTRESHEKRIIKELEENGVEVVILAGYMRIITKYFVSAYKNKILNIHPALLPSFKGTHAQEKATTYGVKITGATVHFVDEEMDHGPIIIQGAIPISPFLSPDEVAAKILTIEHRIYPQAIEWLSQGRLEILGNKVILHGSQPLADISDIMPCLISPSLEDGF